MSYWATWDEVWSQISTFAPASLWVERNSYDIGITDALTFGYSEDGYWGLVLAVSNIKNMLDIVLGFYDATNILGFDIYAAIYYAKSGGVDMASILTAMLGADFTQLKQFIGIEDAYRATIFDQPFDAEYYAKLVRTWRT